MTKKITLLKELIIYFILIQFHHDCLDRNYFSYLLEYLPRAQIQNTNL
jgi:hypothetical protein